MEGICVCINGFLKTRGGVSPLVMGNFVALPRFLGTLQEAGALPVPLGLPFLTVQNFESASCRRSESFKRRVVRCGRSKGESNYYKLDAAMVSVASFFPKDAFLGGITAVCLPAICKRYSCVSDTSSHPSVFGVLRAKIPFFTVWCKLVCGCLLSGIGRVLSAAAELCLAESSGRSSGSR